MQMPTYRCPNCRELLDGLYDYEANVSCNACSHSFALDSENLARFALPQRLVIEVRRPEGTLWDGARVVVLVHTLPPMTTDSASQVVLTNDLFDQAKTDCRESDKRDVRRDFSLVRFLTVWAPTKPQARQLASQRRKRGGRLSPSEKARYDTLTDLLEGYTPPDVANVASTPLGIDLERPPERAILTVIPQ